MKASIVHDDMQNLYGVLRKGVPPKRIPQKLIIGVDLLPDVRAKNSSERSPVIMRGDANEIKEKGCIRRSWAMRL